MNNNVIILAAGPNGLGALRSLYQQRIRSSVIVRDRNDISLYSRLPIRKWTIENQKNAIEQDQLLQLLMSIDGNYTLIPTSDWYVTFLAEYKSLLITKFSFITPEIGISNILIDKARETEVIQDIIPIPKTLQELTNESALLATLTLPIIVKPRSHKHMVLGKKNIVIKTLEELSSFFQQYQNVLPSVIAQEIIQGDDSNQWVCNCFFDRNSNLTQAFTFNRLRLSPSHYGVTSYAMSKLNQEVIELSRKLGKELNYSGPAMIEFKQDPKDNQYKYIEINPRLGMCNFFDASCGINNAYATYCLATSQPIPESKQMEENVIFLSFYEDLFSRLRDGERLGAVLGEYIKQRLTKKHVFIYFVWWDPMPSISLALKQASQSFKGLLKKVIK